MFQKCLENVEKYHRCIRVSTVYEARLHSMYKPTENSVAGGGDVVCGQRQEG